MDHRLLQVSRVAQVSSPRSSGTVVTTNAISGRPPVIATPTGNVSTVQYQIMTPTELAARSGCQVPFIFKSPQSSPPPPQLIATNTTQHYIMDSNQTLKSVQVVQPVQPVQAVVLTTSSGSGNSPTVQSPQVFATHNGQVLPVIPAGTIINTASVPVTVPVAVSVSPNHNLVKVEQKLQRLDNKIQHQSRQRKVVNISSNQCNLQQQQQTLQQLAQIPLPPPQQPQQKKQHLVIKQQTIDMETDGPQKPKLQRLQQPQMQQSQQRQQLQVPSQLRQQQLQVQKEQQVQSQQKQQLPLAQSPQKQQQPQAQPQQKQHHQPQVQLQQKQLQSAQRQQLLQKQLQCQAQVQKRQQQMQQLQQRQQQQSSQPQSQLMPQQQQQKQQQSQSQQRQPARDTVAISRATSPVLISPRTTLAVTKPFKSYSHCKTRKKDKEEDQVSSGSSSINKPVEQQVQPRRPAITISPIPRTVTMTNACVNTASSSATTEEKMQKDLAQNRLQQNPQQQQQQVVPQVSQKVFNYQTVAGVNPAKCQQLLIVMSNSGEEQWLQLTGNPMSNNELTEMLKKSGVPETTIEECRTAIISSEPGEVIQVLHDNDCDDVNTNTIVDEEECLIEYTDTSYLDNEFESGNSNNAVNSSTSPTMLVETAAMNTGSSTEPDAGDQTKSELNAIPAENRVGKLAICPYCGLSSPTFDQCARCKYKFPADVKCIPIKNIRAIDKNSQIALQIIGRSPQQLTRKCSTDSSGNSNNSSPECPKKKTKVQERKRSKMKVEEPVCLTISSDEENDEPDSVANRSGTSKIVDSSCNDNKYNFSCDPAVTQSAMLKEPVINDDNNSTLSLESMETDELKDNASVNAAITRLQPENFEYEQHTDVLEITERIMCRTVRIGSYKVVPSDDAFFLPRAISISVPSITASDETVNIIIPYSQVVKVLAHYGRGMPVFFIYTTPAMGAKIRDSLNMTSKDSYYYDPSSKVETQKRITLLPEKINDDTKCKIKSILTETNPKLHEELSSKEANDILVRASPKEVQNILKKTGMPPPAPLIQTIMVYPPPPMKGGIPINTEDYACLGEDQFLNDVIIDFYLKYLTQMSLREEDQARTHVFSSFFYKRLTTKPTGSRRSYNPTEDNPDITPAEKRHSRVKSWTKAVNIFTKDFIIIPVNENCHWFLAIICFPGLTGPVRFSDNTPITLPASKPRRRHSSLAEGCTDKELATNVMAGKTSLMIGSTTITAVNSTLAVPAMPANPTITLEAEEEDRDEADGEDEDWEDEFSEDDQESCDNSSKGSDNSQQLPLIKDTNAEEEDESSSKISEPDESVKQQSSIPPSPSPSKSTSKGAVREPIKQPCILIFDSLAGASRAKVVATLRDYLRIEYRVKHGHDRDFSKNVMKGASPKVPQQTNYTDCGLYLLQYVEAFFQDPIPDYHVPIKMLQDWFTADVVSRKRYDLQQLLLHLMQEQGVNIAALNLPDLNLRPPGLVPYPDTDPEDMEEGEEEEEEEDDEEGYFRELMEEYGEEEEEEEEEEEDEDGYVNYEEDMFDVCGADNEDEHMESMSCSGDHMEVGECDERHKIVYDELLEEPMPKVDLKSYRIPRLIREVRKTPNRRLDDKKMSQENE